MPLTSWGSAPAATSRRATAVRNALRSIFHEHRGAAVALVVCAFLAGLAESAILALVAHAATAMVDGSTATVVEIGPIALESSIGRLLLLAGVLAALRLGLAVALAYLPARMAADIQMRLRTSLFDAYATSSWEVQSRERDGHLQELLTTQVVQATQGLQQATTLLSAGLTFLTLALTAFTIGPVVALLVLVVGGGMTLLLRPLGGWGRRHAGLSSRAQVDYAETLGGSLRLAEETYAFGAAAAEQSRLRDRATRVRHHFLRAQLAQRLTQGLYQGLVILLLVGGLAGLNASGTGRIASLGTVVLILVRAAAYGQLAQFAWQVLQQSAPFLERLEEAEERYRSNPPVQGDRPFPVEGPLRLRGVSFGYLEERRVLDDLNLEIPRGSVVGIVGSSGAGKSTLVQLLLRMRRPDVGTITVGDTPVDEIRLDAWRRHVAYVPQDSRLLDATVADNIRFARDLPDDELRRAARLANVHDVIERMPDGYQTMIGQRVDAVSGGQRQRICLARGLAGRPDILILDEPTSSLDLESEAAIQDSLSGLRGELTLIIVSHRPSLLEICDLLIEMSGGTAQVRPGPASTPTSTARADGTST